MGIDKPTEIPVDKVKKLAKIFAYLFCFLFMGNCATLIRYVFL